MGKKEQGVKFMAHLSQVIRLEWKGRPDFFLFSSSQEENGGTFPKIGMTGS